MSMQHVQQFSNSAVLIQPQAARDIIALEKAPPRTAESTMAAGEQCAGAFYSSGGSSGKPFPFAAGVAVIPVWGVLLHRDRFCDSWATGYAYIQAAISAALGDDDVKGIMFDVNSPGGHVAGCWEVSDLIFKSRGQKPMMALVDARACSAAYAIGSAAGRMVATSEASVGSIGVYIMHSSYEKMMEQLGIETTFIFAGKHKVDGNPYEALPEDVRASLQASVERSYEKFVAQVARNRGLDPDAVRSTEARVYDAEAAKGVGLIDDVMAPRDAFASFLSEVNTASTLTKEAMTMSKEQAPGGGDAPDQDKIRSEAAATERQRVAGIVGCEEANGREALARHFAFSTSMSVDEAKAALAAAPIAKADPAPAAAAAAAPAAPNALAAAMAATGGGANVAPDGADDQAAAQQKPGLLKAAADLGYIKPN